MRGPYAASWIAQVDDRPPLKAFGSVLTLALVLVAACSARPSANAANARSGDSTRVPVLVYHNIARHRADETSGQRNLDVDTAVFRVQMDYIAQHKYPVVALGDLIDELNGRRELPAGAVVITFDDGWQDQYDVAFPILQQHHFTATFFIYTNAIGNGPAFMTWSELREMRRAGMTIAAHSRTHPVLTRPGVPIADEINGSRTDIERNLGVAPDLFAYPYGAWDARVVAAVRAAGFRGARALQDGPMNTARDVFAIRALLATDDMPVFERILAGRKPSEE